MYINKRSTSKTALLDCSGGVICSISSSKQGAWSSLKTFWFVSFIYNFKQIGCYLASAESLSKSPQIFLFSAVSLFSSHLFFFRLCKTFLYCMKTSVVSFLLFRPQKRQTEDRSGSSLRDRVLVDGISASDIGVES